MEQRLVSLGRGSSAHAPVVQTPVPRSCHASSQAAGASRSAREGCPVPASEATFVLSVSIVQVHVSQQINILTTRRDRYEIRNRLINILVPSTKYKKIPQCRSVETQLTSHTRE